MMVVDRVYGACSHRYSVDPTASILSLPPSRYTFRGLYSVDLFAFTKSFSTQSMTLFLQGWVYPHISYSRYDHCLHGAMGPINPFMPSRNCCASIGVQHCQSYPASNPSDVRLVSSDIPPPSPPVAHPKCVEKTRLRWCRRHSQYRVIRPPSLSCVTLVVVAVMKIIKDRLHLPSWCAARSWQTTF